jgi:hypothetical protein
VIEAGKQKLNAIARFSCGRTGKTGAVRLVVSLRPKQKPRPTGNRRTGAEHSWSKTRKTAQYPARRNYYTRWLFSQRLNKPQSDDFFHLPFDKKASS